MVPRHLKPGNNSQQSLEKSKLKKTNAVLPLHLLFIMSMTAYITES